MDILINGYPINVELESEKKLRDVVNSLATWIAERNLVFYSIQADGRNFQIDNVPDEELTGIRTINCIVKSQADIVFSAIDEGAAYCKRVLDYVQGVKDGKKIDRAGLGHLEDGIDWLDEVLLKALHILGLHETTRYRDRILLDYLAELKNIKPVFQEKNDEALVTALSGKRELFFDLQNILKMLLLSDEMKKLIVQSIESPDALLHSLKSVQDTLHDQLANIEETAIAFQKGKDAEGTDKLNRFIDFIYGYTRTCCQIAPVFGVDLSAVRVGDISLEEKNSAIRDLLLQISEAMENRDMVTLSDILEYEIIPLLKNIDMYIGVLLAGITGRKS